MSAGKACSARWSRRRRWRWCSSARPGDIIFTNRSARELFFEGMAVEGENFLSMIKRAPAVAAPGAALRGGRALQRRGSGRARDVSPVAATPRRRPDADRGQERHAGDQSTRGREPQEGHSHHRSRDQQLARPDLVADRAPRRSILQRPEHMPRLSTMFDTIQERALHLQRLPRRIRQAREDPSAQAGLGSVGSLPRRPARILAGAGDRGGAHPARLLRPRADSAGAHQPDQECA